MNQRIYHLIFLLVGIPSLIQAQENRTTLIPSRIMQKSFVVGGSMGGSYQFIKDQTPLNTHSSHDFQGNLEAKLGYFVLRNLALGVKGQVNYLNQHDSNSYTLVGPFLRYYWYNGLFGEGSYVIGKNDDDHGEKNNLTELKAGVGYSLFLHPNIALEPAIMVNRFRENRTGADNQLRQWGPALNLGLQVYLFREKKISTK